MKTIIIILTTIIFITPVVAQDRVKIDLGTEVIHGKERGPNSLCNPIAGSEANRQLIKRYLKANAELNQISRKQNKATRKANNYLDKITDIRKRVTLSNAQVSEYNILTDIANDLITKNNIYRREINEMADLDNNAKILLLKTTAKGRPSFYALQVATETSEQYLKSGKPMSSLNHSIQFAEIRKQQYLIYKEAENPDAQPVATVQVPYRPGWQP